MPSSQWFTHYCFTVIGYIFEVCSHTTILHVTNEKGTGADICPPIVSGRLSGIVIGDSPVSYWPIVFLFLSLSTVPEAFAKVNSAQVPSRF